MVVMVVRIIIGLIVLGGIVGFIKDHKWVTDTYPLYKINDNDEHLLLSGVNLVKTLRGLKNGDTMEIKIQSPHINHTILKLWSADSECLAKKELYPQLSAFRSSKFNVIYITIIESENEWIECLNHINREDDVEIPTIIKEKKWWKMTLKNNRECSIERISYEDL